MEGFIGFIVIIYAISSMVLFPVLAVYSPISVLDTANWKCTAQQRIVDTLPQEYHCIKYEHLPINNQPKGEL